MARLKLTMQHGASIGDKERKNFPETRNSRFGIFFLQNRNFVVQYHSWTKNNSAKQAFQMPNLEALFEINNNTSYYEHETRLN